MSDDTLTPAVREWLRRTAAMPPEAHRSANEVMARLPQVRQRSRWWPLPTYERTSALPTTDQRSESPLTAIPAANGRSATVTGRTQSMFSPSKALVAGALVFALGGVLLIAQPSERRAATTPGAASAEPAARVTAPVEFTGLIECGPDARTGMTDITLSETDTSVARSRGWAWQTPATMSDPRLEGTYHFSYDDDQYRTKGVTTVPSVGTGTWRIENEEGAWQGSHPSIGFSDGTYSRATTILRGEGAYEGLTVIWEEQHDYAACTWAVRGIIIEGDVPTAPEPLSGE